MAITLRVSQDKNLVLTDNHKNNFKLINSKHYKYYKGYYDGKFCIVRHYLPENELEESLSYDLEHPILKLKPDFIFSNLVRIDKNTNIKGEFWVYNVPNKTLNNCFSRSDDKTIQKYYIYQIAKLIKFLNQRGIYLKGFCLSLAFVRDDHSIVIISLPLSKIITPPSENNNHLNSELSIDILKSFSSDLTFLGLIAGYLLTGKNPEIRVTQRYTGVMNIYKPFKTYIFENFEKLSYIYQKNILNLLSINISKKMLINQVIVSFSTIFELDGTESVVPKS
jgi:hypothetical protein